MVSIFSRPDREAVEQAIEQAEKNTSAQIVIAVFRVSDSYIDVILLYGLLLAYFLTLGLWMANIDRHFIDLLAIQLAVLLSLFFIPLLHRLVWRLVPKRILHERSARKALEEYHRIHRRLPVTTPLVLLFVSLGERYTHIISSHMVYEKIADAKWDEVIQQFAAMVSSHDVTRACITAIGQIATVLKEYFPASASHATGGLVIE